LTALGKGPSVADARVELEHRMSSSVTTPTKIKHLVVGTPQGVAGDLRKGARYAFNYSAHEPRSEISLTFAKARGLDEMGLQDIVHGGRQ
jgi:hypothetical protein